ncbi:MAG: hypothetical protein AVDCRST_MAG11-4201 [uncultured Gemmatimonadaceae bacterium]|uniref:Uncharacterized protein n=1 Tax=uncultured Gemmatimonadaceae bacterium TaxID=246130 RepID=A0A6J4ML07_9BACT|nr:MAG: hypothetical protein AVDCRST_MAG11-4201 [uncultured Gemmatimonadaceae bacterium]
MPRALTLKRTVVPHPERKRYVERLALRRDYYRRANCDFRVFEEAGLAGAFIELTEAADAAALAAAHASAPDAVFDAARVYKEVEIQ